MTKVVWTRFGAESRRALEGVISEMVGNCPPAPVTVVSPSEASALHLRRCLVPETDGDAPGLAGVRFTTLTKVAEFLAADGTETALPAASRAAKMLAASFAVSGSSLLPEGQQEGGLGTVAAFLSTFEEIRKTDGDGVDDEEVLAAYRRWRGRLKGRFFDQEDVLESALGSHLFESLGRVVLFLPRPQQGRTGRLINKLAGLPGAKVILGISGRGSDDPTLKWGLDLGASHPKLSSLQASCTVSLVVEPDDEAHSSAVWALKKAGEGVPLRDLAWLAWGDNGLLEQAASHLKLAGIPHHGGCQRTLRDTLAGKALSGFGRIQALMEDRESLFDWLGSAPMAWRGKAIDCPAWRRTCLSLKLRRDLTSWPSRLREEGREPDLSDLLEALGALLSGHSNDWRSLSQELCQSWKNLLPPIIDTEDSESREAISNMLEEAASFDRIGPPGSQGISLLVESILSQPIPPRTRMGEGVFLGTPDQAAGLDFQEAVFAGMREGAWPPRLAEDPVLPSTLRSGGLLSTRVTLENQRGIWDSLLFIAPRIVLSMSRADRSRNAPSLPSVWLLEAASRLAGKRMFADDLLSVRSGSWLDFSDSREAALRSGEIATEADHHVVTLLRDGATGHPLLLEPQFKSSWKLLSSRRSADLTAYDGVVGPLPHGSSYEFSASSLEALAKCPLQWFFKRRLGLPDESEREEDEPVSPLDRGRLIHSILAGYLQARIDDPQANRPQIIERIAKERLDEYEKTGAAGPPALWQPWRSKALEALVAFCDIEAAFPGGELQKPEWEFGGSGPEFCLDIGGNVPMRVRGMVDRWQSDLMGQCLVVDYKVGDPSRYGGTETDPLRGGREVQLPLYSLVVQQAASLSPSAESCYCILNPKDWKWTLRELKLDHEQWDRFRGNLRSLHQLALNGVLPADPGQEGMQSHCASCAYDRCCPATRFEEAKLKSKSELIADWKGCQNPNLQPGEVQKPALLYLSEGAKAERCSEEPEGDDDDRRAISDDLDETLLVEAGAGTGKTTALVSRLVNLLAQGTPLSKIAAITFTRKAAGELKERVRREIELRLQQEDSPALKEALEAMECAVLETIHGFCQGVLSRRPRAGGLPPGFTIVEKAVSLRQVNQWWGQALDRLLADPESREAWRHLLNAGVSPRRLGELAEKLASRWDLLGRCGSLTGGGMENLVEAIMGPIPTEDELSDCSDPNDILWRSFETLRQWQHELKQGRVPTDLPKPTKRGGTAKAWRNLEHWKQRRADLIEGRERAEAFVKLCQFQPVLDQMVKMILDEASSRIARGQITFEDILILTVKALRSDKALRDEIRSQFERVFVDEFQDTDPLQVEILFLIAGHDEDPPEEWQSAAVAPGRLFFVGDPKQSIYRFRGADLSVYTSVKEWVQRNGKVLSLRTNFRSSQEIIRAVNTVFAKTGLGLDETDDLGWPESCLKTGSQPSVCFFGGALDLTAAEIREKESADVALLVLKAMSEGWQTREKNGQLRRLNLKDIAVLLPKRTALSSLTRALDAKNIPFRVDSRTLLLATPEARDLTTLLMAIEDPLDEASIVGALRSPLFGCSDVELADNAGKGWDYRRRDSCSSPLLAASFEVLRRLHELKPCVSAFELIVEAVSVLRLNEKAALQPRPRDRWRRMQLFLSFARECKDGLRPFLSLLKGMEESNEDAPISIVDEADDDAVKITTIHASKGLEYPCVILTGLGSRSSGGRDSPVFWNNGRPEFKLGSDGPCTADFVQCHKAASRDDTREENRLTYVGATRAKDVLAVSLYRKGQGESMAGRIQTALMPLNPIPEALDNFPPLASADHLGFAAIPGHHDWLLKRDQVLAGARGRRLMTPSRLLKISGQGVPNEAQRSTEDQESREVHKAGGADLGRAVHSVLQLIDLEGPPDRLDALCEIQAKRESQSASEVNRLVRSALEAPILKRAAGMKQMREAYFSAQLEGVLIEGYIDLFAWDEANTCLILDYKTDLALTDAAVEEKMKSYRLQAACYSLMVKANFPEMKPEACLIFLRRGAQGEQKVLDLEEAEEEVRRLLRQSSIKTEAD